VRKDIDVEELKKDFENILQAYWYAIRTRDSYHTPAEQIRDEHWTVGMMKKWGVE